MPEITKKDEVPMPKFYATKNNRILTATPTLHANRSKLGLTPVAGEVAKVFQENIDKAADARKNPVESMIAESEAEIAAKEKAAEEKLTAKAKEVKAAAEAEAANIIAAAKAEAEKIAEEAKTPAKAATKAK